MSIAVEFPLDVVKQFPRCSGAGSGSCEFSDSGAGNDYNTGDIRLWKNHIDEDGEPLL